MPGFPGVGVGKNKHYCTYRGAILKRLIPKLTENRKAHDFIKYFKGRGYLPSVYFTYETEFTRFHCRLFPRFPRTK